jgi:hypothetical protein
MVILLASGLGRASALTLEEVAVGGGVAALAVVVAVLALWESAALTAVAATLTLVAVATVATTVAAKAATTAEVLAEAKAADTDDGLTLLLRPLSGQMSQVAVVAEQVIPVETTVGFDR